MQARKRVDENLIGKIVSLPCGGLGTVKLVEESVMSVTIENYLTGAETGYSYGHFTDDGYLILSEREAAKLFNPAREAIMQRLGA